MTHVTMSVVCPGLAAEFLDVFYDKFLPRILDVIPSDKSINPK